MDVAVQMSPSAGGEWYSRSQMLQGLFPGLG